MSDVDDTTDNDDNSTGPKALREQNSKLTKDLEDLRKQLGEFQTKERTRTIADVLAGAKANPKLAKYVARDLDGDVDEASVKKWLADEGELFGYTPPTEGEEVDEPLDETAQAQQQISAASAAAKPPATGWTPERLKGMTPKQLIEAGLLDPK